MNIPTLLRSAKAVNAALRVIALTTLSLTCVTTIAQTKPLNDTGITFCGGAANGNNNPCLAADPTRQDKHYGRDATAIAGSLSKTGSSAGTNGFDFTKIANNGADLLPAATLGVGLTDWACTKDNVTGLLWEVKVNNTAHLRHMSWSYTWFDTASPDGNVGTASGGVCKTVGRCDTQKFVADVNSVGLCGFNDWRLATGYYQRVGRAV